MDRGCNANANKCTTALTLWAAVSSIGRSGKERKKEKRASLLDETRGGDHQHDKSLQGLEIATKQKQRPVSIHGISDILEWGESFLLPLFIEMNGDTRRRV